MTQLEIPVCAYAAAGPRLSAVVRVSGRPDVEVTYVEAVRMLSDRRRRRQASSDPGGWIIVYDQDEALFAEPPRRPS